MTTTANTFGINQFTLTKVITEVCSGMLSKKSEFEAKFGITQACGCIHGTHIPLKAPKVNSQDYYNYKQFYLLNIQGVCDYKGYFMDVDCRWPGSCYDVKVYTNSSINRKMQHKEISII